MASYIVTGAGRGLGLELVKVLAAQPNSEVSTIFATIRSSTPTALQEIVSQSAGRVILIHLEATNANSISAAVDKVKAALDGRGLDVLINNAAVSVTTPGGIAGMTDLRETFEVNVEAVHNITVALLPLLREGKRKTVLNMSSIVGSITLAERFLIAPCFGYKVSKAALNSLTKLYAIDMDGEGFTFVAVAPGVSVTLHNRIALVKSHADLMPEQWLRTDQGGPYADLDAETGAKAVLDLLKRDRSDLNGKFLNIHVPGWEKTTGLHQYDGAEIPF